MHYKQNGFAILETILILVVIGVIGATGWYALHTKNQTDKILAQSEKTSQSTINQNKTAQTAQQYLVIKEWGVRLKLSAGTSSPLLLYSGG